MDVVVPFNWCVDQVLNKYFQNASELAINVKEKGPCGVEYRLVDGTERIKDVLKKQISSSNTFTYHVVNPREYVDIHLNNCTRFSIGAMGTSYRFYCSIDTTIQELETEIEGAFQCKKGVYGLYGWVKREKSPEYNNIDVFKLKPEEHVLFAKMCFAQKNFFQYQFLSEFESLKNLESTFEGKFFRLKSKDNILLFKRRYVYSIRETVLIRLKNGEIVEEFYDVHRAQISTEKIHGKHLIIITDEEKEWVLCSLDEYACEQMYFSLLSCRSLKSVRLIVGDEEPLGKENLSDKNEEDDGSTGSVTEDSLIENDSFNGPFESKTRKAMMDTSSDDSSSSKGSNIRPPGKCNTGHPESLDEDSEGFSYEDYATSDKKAKSIFNRKPFLR
jgi:hypothetical protein